MRRQPAPPICPVKAEVVESPGLVSGNASRENLRFPGVGWRLEALQLLQDFQRASLTCGLSPACDVLPAEQPSHELCRGDGRDLAPQCAERQPMDPRQQAAIAPLDGTPGLIFERPSQNAAAGFEPQQRAFDVVG